MTTYSEKPATANKAANGAGSMTDFTPSGDGLWWPFRNVAKALLQTQNNANAYLEANRRLVDEMRNMIRKEQDLILELSEGVLKEMSKSNRPPNGRTVPNSTELNHMFDRAATGMRELSEAWIDVQVRSLDIMRSYSDTRQKTAERTTDQTEARAA